MPEYRNKGYAQQAIKGAEHIHGKQHWKLDTILQEIGNCYLGSAEKALRQRKTTIYQISSIIHPQDMV
jgi:hypothetical protein